MRESCMCGGFIATFSYRRVKNWRATHVHDGRPEPEPEKQGAHAQVELASDRRWEIGEQSGGGGQDVPVVYAKTGFRVS